MSARDDHAHIATLDGLRGVAALMVVASHCPLWGLGRPVNVRAGEYGVLLFFVLSGFLMGHLYLARPFDRHAVARYAVARAARIVPLYYIVVIASFLLSPLLAPDFVYHVSPFELVRLLAFCGRVSVFWSIGPEVQFYVLFVGIWYAAARGWFASLPVLALAGLGVTLTLLAQPLFPGVVLPSKLHVFLIGLATALLLRRATTDDRMVHALVAAQVTALAILCAVAILPGPVADLLNPPIVPDDRTNAAMYGQLRVILPVAAILLAFTRETGLSRAVFANPPARAIGRWSFSIYLLNMPVLSLAAAMFAGSGVPVFIRGAVAAAMVVAASAASFALIERPAQRLIRGAARRRERIAPSIERAAPTY